MRRVALLRHTPLRQRRPHRPWTRAEEDKVTEAERTAVFVRDQLCIAARVDREHGCRDVWGTPHRPDDMSKMTLEHVRPAAAMGKRAPSTRRWMVAACSYANLGGWCSANRDIIRAYLAVVEPGD